MPASVSHSPCQQLAHIYCLACVQHVPSRFASDPIRQLLLVEVSVRSFALLKAIWVPVDHDLRTQLVTVQSRAGRIDLMLTIRRMSA